MEIRLYQRLSVELWQRLVEKQQQSGLAQRAFCEAHGLTVSTFNNWKRRLAITRPKGVGGFKKLFAPPPEVALPHGGEAAEAGWEIKLDLGGGVCLRLRRR